jgi:hypothetical protein
MKSDEKVPWLEVELFGDEALDVAGAIVMWQVHSPRD